MLYLNKEQFQEMTGHCREEYPKESCGILAGKISPQSTVDSQRLKLVNKVYRMANVSEKPEICYFMRPAEQFKVFKEMRTLGIEMLGIYHSHIGTPAYPSQRDCEMAFYPETSYVIVSLQDFNKPEIRSFKILDGKIKEEKIMVQEN
ncbi:hypothetical protein COS16_06570 [Candidatus Desantisbacteria bacterium CG02_land_8_20_14_3_00_49_13]|nr:MAG: hypothetical protein COS16_06570 [Candidatus Desantisbacteria bacterium CG02_land_8_20_14_3_00_49_13]